MKNFLICILIIGLMPLFAYSQGGVGTVKVEGTVGFGGAAGGATLVSITVSPSSAIVEVGLNQSFSALGTFSDGSQSDVTTQSVWSASPSTYTTNVVNVFTCTAPGSTTVSATIGAVSGTASLTCQVLLLSPPSGTVINVPQGQSGTFLQFTATGGTPPYTFSAPGGLPVFASLALSSTGLLTGNATTVGISSAFTVKVTDSLSNSASGSYQVSVVAAGSEDNRYCT
jgi:hypothetical protein